MDQDSFRRLLQTPRPGGSSVLGGASGSRGSLIGIASKTKTADASQPTFKPRKVKKPLDSKYRDRAAERRVGEVNDYAQVEAVLEEFEKKTADSLNKDEVEAQRRYLGGDSDHTILVKGLDHSLLEQNKAKASVSTEDDDALEEAFTEASSHTPNVAPKKRTREDLIRELKEQRSQSQNAGLRDGAPVTKDEEARLLEDAKQKGKFKPIGFKPIGSSADGKKKTSKNGANEGDRKNKKKKRKVEPNDMSAGKGEMKDASLMLPPPVPTKALKVSEPEELVDDDFNIFADAGDYEDIDVGDDDDDAAPTVTNNHDREEGEEPSSASVPQRWIMSDEIDGPKPSNSSMKPPSQSSKVASGSSSALHGVASDDEMEDAQPTRLVPLSSSALPSIKEFLAMDKAAGSYGKNKKRKDKKKGLAGDEPEEDVKKKTEKKTVEAKVERDYKRLKTYTDKKALSESA